MLEGSPDIESGLFWERTQYRFYRIWDLWWFAWNGHGFDESRDGPRFSFGFRL